MMSSPSSSSHSHDASPHACCLIPFPFLLLPFFCFLFFSFHLSSSPLGTGVGFLSLRGTDAVPVRVLGFWHQKLTLLSRRKKNYWKAIKQFTDSTGSLENLARQTDKNQRRLALERTAKVTPLKTARLGQCHRHRGLQPPLPLDCAEKVSTHSEDLFHSLQIPSPDTWPDLQEHGRRPSSDQKEGEGVPSQSQSWAAYLESRSQETLEIRKSHVSQTPLALNPPYSWPVGITWGKGKLWGSIQINSASSGETKYNVKCSWCFSSDSWRSYFLRPWSWTKPGAAVANVNTLCLQVLFSQLKFRLLNSIPLTSYILTLNGTRAATF